MTRSQSIFWKGALGLALWFGAPAAGFAAEAPAVTVLGSLSGELRAPGQMALDSGRVLYVADAQRRGVARFDKNGSYLGLIPVSGVVRGVACTSDGRIVVSHDGFVHLYTASGAPAGALSGYGFGLPNGIACDPAGNIYVADSKANQVAVFNASGLFVSAFGAKGTGPGQFNFPTDLAYEVESQQLAVADTMNNRIQFFDASGAFKRVIGSPAKLSGPLRFTYPQGIAFDYANGARMYVADAFQSSVQVIELGPLPRFLSYLGAFGTAPGELQHPSDLVFDAASSELLVSDTSGRINIYRISAPAAGESETGSGTGTGSGGSGTGTGTGTAGTAGGSGEPGTAGSQNGTWQYPAGVDCRHARAGSVVCHD